MIEIEVRENANDINLSVEQNEAELQLETSEVIKTTTDDYEQLRNKPKLNGVVLVGDIAETDPTVPTWAKAGKKPEYTPEEVNAVNAENTITLDEIEALFNGL